jgi:hypothetical protein
METHYYSRNYVGFKTQRCTLNSGNDTILNLSPLNKKDVRLAKACSHPSEIHRVQIEFGLCTLVC